MESGKRAVGAWYAQSVMYNAALLISGGTIFQTFLLGRGVTGAMIGVYSTFTLLTQSLTMFVFSLFADRIRDVKRAYACFTLMQIPFYVFMLFMCGDGLYGDAVFRLILLPAALLNTAIGLRTVLAYKMPFLIIDMKGYGRFTVTECILVSVVSVLFSYIAERLLTHAEFLTAMRILFAAALGFITLSAVFVITLKTSGAPDKASERKTIRQTLSIVREPRFYRFIIPNFARGLAIGIMGMAAVFAASDNGFDSAQLSRLALAGQAASFAAYIVYRAAVTRYGSKPLLTLGCALFVCLPFMAVTGSVWLYLALYFMAQAGHYFISVAVPVMVAEFIPYEIMGSYTACRMLLTNGGNAVGALIGGLAVGKIGSIWLFAAAFALMLICTISYRGFARVARPDKENI